MTISNELQSAVDAVRRASLLCRDIQQTLVTEETLTKKDRSPVTVADFCAQALITLNLIEADPEAAVIGEESADELRSPDNSELKDRVVSLVQKKIWPLPAENDVLDAIDRGCAEGGATGSFWTIDPIDGTKGFLRGEQYAVALARLVDGEVVLGVLGCPNMPVDPEKPDGEKGCIFAAEKGAGAFQIALSGGEPSAIRVSDETDPARAVFCESVEAGHSAHDESERITRHLGVSAPPLRIDSQCKYAAVARGQASIYLRMPTRADYRECIWDHAAGAIIVSEAGGAVSDIDGKPLDFSLGRRLSANRGVAVTNGALQTALMDAITASAAV
ncbi:MAG: 3'(2'),5'-bisphosphate nucleotidase [bacterium]|nr:3'(2'),5'-bisphosphate nucleotidase [bacterium]